MAVAKEHADTAAAFASASYCRHCTSPLEERFRFCPACGAVSAEPETPTDGLIGRTIGGSYAIRELVGVGGMGRVYRAEQTTLGRSVAVKVIHPHLLTNEQVVARFYREAKAASSLNHPNSVGIIDFGRAQDGTLYLVMELLRGRDLGALVDDEGPLPLDRACSIMVDVLAALGEAHASGVVHRDLKPENIFIEQLKAGRDLVKVVDFGIATLANEQASNVTLPGLLCGTPAYMSPEQVSGGTLDGRSDLYAAGAVLFELLCGRPPFTGETANDIATCHLRAEVPNPRDTSPSREIPHELAELVMHALAKTPVERFAQASEMAEALQALIPELAQRRSRPTPTPSLRARMSAQPAAQTSDPPRAAGLEPGAQRRSQPASKVELIGKLSALSQVSELLERARSGAVFCQLVAETGSGKTRVLRELATRLGSQGHRVLTLGVHPTLAPVAYFQARMLMHALWDTSDAGLLERARQSQDLLLRAGVNEVCGSERPAPRTRASRAAAVAHALEAALRTLAASTDKPIVLILDDAHLFDGGSRAAFDALAQRVAQLPLFCCAAAPEPLGKKLACAAEVVSIGKLTRAQARVYLGEQSANKNTTDPRELPRFLPLFLDQLRALGLNTLDGTLPRDLADAATLRLDRLGPGARRALQALAALGLHCHKSLLSQLAGPLDPRVLIELRSSGLVRENGDDLAFDHPYLRDLVEASIPATARAQLHTRALKLASSAQAPIEVRAQQAWQAGNVITACLLQEEMGLAALRRGDASNAMLAFHRGWKLARSEADSDGHPLLSGVLAAMTRGLAAAVADSGDLAGAEGVLREQLALCEPTSIQRATLLVDLATVACQRGRAVDAASWLVEGMALAQRHAARELEAQALATRAQLQQLQGDRRGEIGSLLNAHDLLARLGTRPLSECAILLRLGSAMHLGGDLAGALQAFDHALSVATAQSAHELAAQACLGRMRVESSRSRVQVARSAGQQAATLALESGLPGLCQLAREGLCALDAGKDPDCVAGAVIFERLWP